MPYIGLGLNQAAGYQPPPPTSPVSTYSSASYHSFDGSGFPARNYQALPANYAYSGGPQSFQHYPSTGSFQTAASTFASDAGSVASSRRTSTQGSTSTQGTGNTQGSSTPQPASNVSGVTTPKPPRKGQAAKRRRTAADNGYHEQASTHAADTLNDTLEINRRLAELLEMTRNVSRTCISPGVPIVDLTRSPTPLLQVQSRECPNLWLCLSKRKSNPINCYKNFSPPLLLHHQPPLLLHLQPPLLLHLQPPLPLLTLRKALLPSQCMSDIRPSFEILER